MIKAGTKLRITHSRKGTFECVAIRDFDPKAEAFFPVRLISKMVEGRTTSWQEREEIPCRKVFVTKMEKIRPRNANK